MINVGWMERPPLDSALLLSVTTRVSSRLTVIISSVF